MLIIKQKKRYFFDEVSITIIGPTSLTEIVITYIEAEELYSTLKSFLNK